MGGIGVTLTVSGEGDRAALMSAIWGRLEKPIWMYGAPTPDMVEYLHEDGMSREVDGDTLGWWFHGFGGCCSRSMHAWWHWLTYAIAYDWDEITALAESRGLTVVSERPAMTNDNRLVDDDTRLLEVRGEHWLVNEDGLNGDDRHIPIDELTAEERVFHARALERCGCGVYWSFEVP